MILKSSTNTSDRNFRILIHGKPGSGKTLSSGATAPAPVLLLTEPGGQDCLSPANIEKAFGIGTPGVSYDVPVLEAFTWPDLDKALTFVETSPEMVHFKTVVVDSVSQISKLALEHFMTVCKDGRKAYGEAQRAVESVFQRLFRLPKDVICTAHSGEVGIGDNILLMPIFSGKAITREIGHHFGEIYFCGTDFDDNGTPKFIINTGKTPGVDAKSRLGHLPPVVPPNWAWIFHYLREGIAKGVTKPAAPAPKPEPEVTAAPAPAPVNLAKETRQPAVAAK